MTNDHERKLIDAANLLHESAQRLPEGYTVSLTVNYSESSIEVTDANGDPVAELGDHEWGYSAWSAAIDAAIEHAAQDKETAITRARQGSGSQDRPSNLGRSGE